MHTECIDHGMTKSLAKMGYGLVKDPRKKSRCTTLHRIVYAEKLNKTLDDITGVSNYHTCDNPRCINPDHLIGGTKADNNRDRAVRGRSAKIVPSRRRLTKEDCDYIVKHTVKYSKTHGVTCIANKFNVDLKVIWKVLKGKYCVQINTVL